MKLFSRITLDPAVMGGKACIRGLRVTVGMVIGLLAAGRSREEILKAYPYLEPDDIEQVLSYAAWRVDEREVELVSACGGTECASDALSGYFVRSPGQSGNRRDSPA